MAEARKMISLGVVKALVVGGIAFVVCFSPAEGRLEYPKTVREAKYVDDYFGVKVSDPYRWLENPDNYGTKKFVKAQKRLTQEYFDNIPEREDIKDAMQPMWNYPTFSTPTKFGGHYFYTANNGTQNQDVLYIKATLEADPEVILDPNAESPDGTVSYGDYGFSHDGKLVAYSVSEGGTDWKHVRIRNITSGEDLNDTLIHTKWPLFAWTKDDQGFFYPRYPTEKDGKPSPLNRKIYYHKLDTDQSEDILIAEFPEHPHWLLELEVSKCGKYLILSIYEDFDPNGLYIAPLQSGTISKGFQKNFVPIAPNVTEAKYEYITNIGTRFLFLSNKNATNYKVISMELGPNDDELNDSNNETIVARSNYTFDTVIEEDPERVLSWSWLIDERFFLLCYVGDVRNSLEMVHFNDTAGKRYVLPLEPGTISSFGGGKGNDTEFLIRYESYVTPGIIYRCNVETGDFNCQLFTRTQVDNINLSDFTFKQVFYPSHDGTAVPMYIIHHKNFTPDGTAPAVLRGYGGFGINLLPKFSIFRLFFIQSFGGIYATANIRGGGEYGTTWHDDGRLLKKQNAFDDFQAAAEYLIFENYTNPRKLAISGSSNGGLLVATCVNQRPELYGAANVDVGVLDMLRFQKFTGGFHWCTEYGCSDNEEDFRNLIKYSPLHNIRMPPNDTVQYPAVLVSTADHDDRVVPSHSYKYVAELQHVIGNHPKQENPLLLRVDTDAGHGEGKSDAKEFEEKVDLLAFYMRTMNLTLQSFSPYPPGLQVSRKL